MDCCRAGRILDDLDAIGFEMAGSGDLDKANAMLAEQREDECINEIFCIGVLVAGLRAIVLLPSCTGKEYNMTFECQPNSVLDPVVVSTTATPDYLAEPRVFGIKFRASLAMNKTGLNQLAQFARDERLLLF